MSDNILYKDLQMKQWIKENKDHYLLHLFI